MRVVIIGAGGHARVIINIMMEENKHTIVGVIDKIKHTGETIEEIPVLCTLNNLSEIIEEKNIEGAIVAIGDNLVREKYFEEIKRIGLKPINAIHPSASIAPNVEMGEGIVVAREANICVGAKIGDNCIINTGAIVEHQNIMENHSNVAPGVNLAGKVTLKEGAFVGIGSSVTQKITIGKNSIIGAGSVVITDIPQNVVAVGIPAKVIKPVSFKEEFGEMQGITKT